MMAGLYALLPESSTAHITRAEVRVPPQRRLRAPRSRMRLQVVVPCLLVLIHRLMVAVKVWPAHAPRRSAAPSPPFFTPVRAVQYGYFSDRLLGSIYNEILRTCAGRGAHLTARPLAALRERWALHRRGADVRRPQRTNTCGGWSWSTAG